LKTRIVRNQSSCLKRVLAGSLASSDLIPVEHIARIREGQVKAVVVASNSVDVEELAKLTRGVIFAYRLPRFTYVEA